MKYLKLILLPLYLLILTGCNETPTIYYDQNYSGQPIRVSENLYFKQVKIQDMKALLQCDKDGNITHNQNINAGYQAGKVFVSTTTITPTIPSSESDFKFNFKCIEIDNCYEQILIVKNVLNK